MLHNTHNWCKSPSSTRQQCLMSSYQPTSLSCARHFKTITASRHWWWIFWYMQYRIILTCSPRSLVLTHISYIYFFNYTFLSIYWYFPKTFLSADMYIVAVIIYFKCRNYLYWLSSALIKFLSSFHFLG